jgi:hypothetical protein
MVKPALMVDCLKNIIEGILLRVGETNEVRPDARNMNTEIGQEIIRTTITGEAGRGLAALVEVLSPREVGVLVHLILPHQNKPSLIVAEARASMKMDRRKKATKVAAEAKAKERVTAMNLPVVEVEAIILARAQRKGAEAGASAIARKGTEAGVVEVEEVRNAATATVGGNDQEEIEMTIVIIHGNDGDDLNPLNQIIHQVPLPVMRRPPRRLLMSQP